MMPGLFPVTSRLHTKPSRPSVLSQLSATIHFDFVTVHGPGVGLPISFCGVAGRAARDKVARLVFSAVGAGLNVVEPSW